MSMTVKELIEKLSKMPNKEAKVIVFLGDYQMSYIDDTLDGGEMFGCILALTSRYYTDGTPVVPA